MRKVPAPYRYMIDEFLTPSFHFSISEYEVSRFHDLHGHEFFEMEIILSGRGTQILNGESSQLVPGSVYLLTPVDFHTIIPDPGFPLRLINLKFTEEWLDEELRLFLFRQPNRLSVRCKGEHLVYVEKECRRLLAECTASRIGKKQAIRATLDRLLVDLLRMIPTDLHTTIETSSSDVPERIKLRKALNYIDFHFREPITLKQAAAYTTWSPNYFSEKFSTIIGQSFQQYVQEHRLQYAHRLLHNSSLPVTEIALASGFNSLPYFIRCFKKKYGFSPSAGRRVL
ncbi:AraC family transcriptional regulator [Paenibacillus qinlingensis]|uniref:AraC-like DNA-binding protein n=1 Tax=Paenibacillus qinlingensis TaxID=1837343 RepID=A0ABU1NSE7_9BACL|nr:AraC family transcriptional regulator [Paenibacillus qinlingensis]MDR6550405.1 AraC-like DNA-binding protein [Paenibacillus qinlingensis]